MKASITARLEAVDASLAQDVLTDRISGVLRQLYKDPSIRFLDEFNVDPGDLLEKAKQKAFEAFFLELSLPLVEMLNDAFAHQDSYVRAFNELFKLYVIAQSYGVGECILEILDQDLKGVILLSD